MEGMVIVFQGSRGSGKTLSMVAEALHFNKCGWDIKANFETPFTEFMGDEEILNIDKNSPLRDCVILIDEMQIFFDSRNWSSKKSIGFSNFMQQIRKRNIVLIGTTQYVDTIEKRIRQHIDLLIKPKYSEKTNVCICTVYDLTSLEDGTGIISYEYAFNALPIFSLYDTYKIL